MKQLICLFGALALLSTAAMGQTTAKPHHRHLKSAKANVNQFSKNVNHEANRESKDFNHSTKRGGKAVAHSANKLSKDVNHAAQGKKHKS